MQNDRIKNYLTKQTLNFSNNKASFVRANFHLNFVEKKLLTFYLILIIYELQ